MAIDPENQTIRHEEAVLALDLLVNQADLATDLRVIRKTLTDSATAVAMSGKVREKCFPGLARHGQKIYNCGTGFVQLDPSSETRAALMEDVKEIAGRQVRGVSLYLLPEGGDPSHPAELAFLRGWNIDVDIIDIPESRVLESLFSIICAIDSAMEKDDGTAPSPTYVSPHYAKDALELSGLLRDRGLAGPPSPLESTKL